MDNMCNAEEDSKFSVIVIGKGELDYHLIVDRAGTVVDVGIGTPKWMKGKKLYTILDLLTDKGFEFRRETKVRKINY